MSQENIWDKALNDDVSNENEKLKSILIKRKNIIHELTNIDLRNYLNTHELDEININSMYDYFDDNIFKNYNELYLPHLICSIPFISYDKRYKALEETFKVISPNIGSNNFYNFNYFQCLMLKWREIGMDCNHALLYQLGIENGLDASYKDICGRTAAYYYAASASIDDIYKYYDDYFTMETNVIHGKSVSIIDILGLRFFDNLCKESVDSVYYNKFGDIFRLISGDSLYHKYIDNYQHCTEEWKTYEKIVKKLQKTKVKK